MRVLLTKIAVVVFFVLTLFLLFLQVYRESYQNHQKVIEATNKTDKRPITSSQKLKNIFKEENKTLDKQYKAIASEIEDYINSQKFRKIADKNLTLKSIPLKEFQSQCSNIPLVKKPKIPKPKKVYTTPKVVIIMDDISSNLQSELIQKIPFKITPSIFPATTNHPDTPSIAKQFKHYMVHMPMEAVHFATPEENTIKVGDSLSIIDERVKAIKKDFPNLIAINNHTGSLFTSDYESMDKLFCALSKYGIHFVDSRTSAQTKGKEVGKMHQDKVWERNVFLDNIDNISKIHQKLYETVVYAKKNKVAIAICHPKEATFKALMQAQNMLRGVDVVYLDELY